MRFNLRLHGHTSRGVKCRAELSVYASSQTDLLRQTQDAATNAAWYVADSPGEPVPEGESITVEHVESLNRTRP